MPTYTYACYTCEDEQEIVLSLSELDIYQAPFCGCGGQTRRVLSAPFVHGEETTWINQDLRNSLQKDGEKPVETRSEYRKYLKQNGIVERHTGNREI